MNTDNTIQLKEQDAEMIKRQMAEQSEPMNIPITSAQIEAYRKKNVGKRGVITVATLPNRKTRRAETEDKRPVINNREKTKARKGNKLFIKMSAFYMSVNGKMIQQNIKRAELSK